MSKTSQAYNLTIKIPNKNKTKRVRNGKKIRVFVLVNTLTSVQSPIYRNHIAFFTWHAKFHPEIDFVFYPPYRKSIDQARNEAAELALKFNCDYLLFLDDDVLIPKDSLWRLIKRDKDICAGNVIIRGMPFNVMAFEFTKRSPRADKLGFFNHIPLVKPCKKGHKYHQLLCEACGKAKLVPMVKLDAVGFSLALIKTSVLQKVSTPYFVTGTGNTEDVYFCIKYLKETKRHSIWMDNTIECAHILNAEPVQFSNRKLLYEYYKKAFAMVHGEDEGRGIGYIDRNLIRLGV